MISQVLDLHGAPQAWLSLGQVNMLTVLVSQAGGFLAGETCSTRVGGPGTHLAFLVEVRSVPLGRQAGSVGSASL